MNKHNFSPGQRLAARMLNELENIVEQNETKISALQTTVGGESGRTTAAIGKLALETDGDNIYLMSDDIQLSSLAISDILVDLDSAVPCTAIQATSGSTIDIRAGNSSQISASVSPSDCTQAIRYMSDSLNVANVSSLGLVRALHYGIANITARCGNKTANVTVNVSERIVPTLAVASWINAQANKITFSQSGVDGAYGIGTSNTTVIKVPAGFSLELNSEGKGSQYSVQDAYFNCVVKFCPTANTAFTVDSNGNTNITGVTGGEALTAVDSMRKHYYCYCQTETWFAVIVSGSTNYVIADNVDSFMTTYPNLFDIVIAPGAGS